jgi:hypothetical protein
MRVKGRKRKDIQTRLGDIRAERCYYCPRCKRGFFLLDDQLQLWDAYFSETLAREGVWSMGLMPDDLVERVFDRIGGVTLPDTSIWRRRALG